ncbi:beta-1,4-glucuronyltransferase 1 isoform X2 [Anthonomus grandis grandis]|uniref:beta-1,4-glucuronyltransferase 1 isoform X2 n=1 Tax=Anthonomus grandis grandis TaxID=2921223 RepID=UPI00216614CC|nr:beta-1,4-glucuronyltransferase 1 isoform X2 [Anthonomus grandis grandis]
MSHNLVSDGYSKWRVWKISILILILLTAYNVFLTIKLMTTTTDCPESQENILDSIKFRQPECGDQQPDQDPFEPDEPRIGSEHQDQLVEKYQLNLNLKLGRSDNRIAYTLFDHVIVGDKFVQLSDTFRTCLATQSSLDKIVSLVESSLHWAGPISLAVFAGSEKELNHILLFILYLRKCNSRIKDKVSFHIAILKGNGPKRFSIDEERLGRLSCMNPMANMHQLMMEINNNRMMGPWRHKLPYPQNLLRNLARKNCHTKYIFLTDVDVIPVKGMAEGLNEFLAEDKCRGKCAYVVPTYEVDERVLFPENKTELIRMASKGLARPFHHKVFIYNQYATNFSRWQNFKDPDRTIRVSHPVTNFEFLYEPFYIATDDVPPHDERFVGYGYTRNTQVYEMFVSGYEFQVLSPIFSCHWGLQVKKNRPPWREHQNNQNRKLFDQFKKEIFAKYNKDPLHMMVSKNNKN